MSDIDRRQYLQGTAAAAGLVALAPGAALGGRTRPARLAPASVHRAVQDQLPQTLQRIQRWIRQPSIRRDSYRPCSPMRNRCVRLRR